MGRLSESIKAGTPVAPPPKAPRPAARIIEERGLLSSLSKNSNLSKLIRGKGVVRSLEFLRVRDLPRRILLGLEDGPEGDALARAVSDLLYWNAGGKGPSPLPLRAVQAAMLVDGAEHGGMLTSTPVGSGKSWFAALFAVERGSVPKHLKDICGGGWPQVECDRPVLLLPPSVKTEMENDVLPLLRRVYKLHPRLTLVAYSELQTARNADVLTRLEPDLLICDEVHNLKNVSSARTRRVKHWLKHNPETVFVGMTGTLTDKSLRDFWHFVLWSHPVDTPLPRAWKELQDWADAVDADVEPLARIEAGALAEFCAVGESPREGLQRRLAETSGFVLVREASVDVPIVISARRDVPLPADVRQMLADLDEAWVTPDNEAVSDAARWAQHARELALGFHYVWDWAAVREDGEPDLEWLTAKNEWAKVVRDVCRRGLPDFDSELRVRNGTRAGSLPKSVLEVARDALAAWAAQAHKPEPPTKPVWHTDAVMEWVSEWMDENVGIVWYEHNAVCEWFMKRRPRDVFSAGMNDELRGFAQGRHGGTRSIICSRPSHYQGKNLQAWSRNLVLTPSPNGKIWEQCLGRTHRAGQKASEVTCEFLAHTDISYSSMADAVSRAKYTQETLGAPQKLLSCIARGWSNVIGERAF